MQHAKTIAATIDMKARLRVAQHFAFIIMLTAIAYFLLAENAHASWLSDITDAVTGADGGGGAFMTAANKLFGGMGAMGEVLCTILLIIIGDAGRGIATLAVMGLGIGAMLGKVSWGQAMTTAVGIAVMFGAPVLLPLLLFDPVGNVMNAATSSSASGAAGALLNVEYPCVDISIAGTVDDMEGLGDAAGGLFGTSTPVTPR